MKKICISLLVFVIFLAFLFPKVRYNRFEGLENSQQWVVKVDPKGDLVFKYKGKVVSKLTKDGVFSSKRCKCGQWHLRDSRIGMPGRNDMNLHKDGWFRAVQYNTPELSGGKHNPNDYTKGGFRGKSLAYDAGGGGKILKQ